MKNPLLRLHPFKPKQRIRANTGNNALGVPRGTLVQIVRREAYPALGRTKFVVLLRRIDTVGWPAYDDAVNYVVDDPMQFDEGGVV